MADDEQEPLSENAPESHDSQDLSPADGTAGASEQSVGSTDAADEAAVSADSSAESPQPVRAVFSDTFDQQLGEDEYDELPDEEPLTPELVEEEAIRGDFMLRWAGILLAVLMAFTQLSDTLPLVLIRSGEYMRANGFLPPSTDPLSLTMQDRTITNVSWMFDHLVSLFWSAGGLWGLTLLKVFVAGLTTWILSRISLPGLPTWWNSICVALAVVACSQDFFPTPELITLPALALTMLLLTRHRLGQVSGLHWQLPLLVAIWCNFDSRAWIGAFVIALYAIGSGINRRGLLRLGAEDDRIPAALGTTAGLSVAALLVNPFPVASLASPLTMYTREFPGMQLQKSLKAVQASTVYDNRVDYYSVLSPDAIWLFDHTHIAAITLILLSTIVIAVSLGSDRPEGGSSGALASFLRGLVRILQLIASVFSGRPAREASFLLPLLGMLVLVILAAHELPAASIVACSAAGIVAQEWYRRNFSQTYTVNSAEILFSRGGRAFTVLCMAVLAFAVVTSRLPGAAPLGVGFDPETQITVDSVSTQLEKLDEDARILHTRLDQGDLLIWSGRRSFVDSRIVPFTSSGNPVLEQHDNVRRALTNRDQPEVSSDPKVKEQFEKEQMRRQLEANETLETYEITHMMVRLAPPGLPDYQSLLMLNASGRFVPVSIEASAAILERIDPQNIPPDLPARIPNFPKMAFQDAEPLQVSLRQFAVPEGFYDRYIYRTRAVTSENRRLATHYMALANSSPERMEEAMSGIAQLTLAIRHLNLALEENPDEVESYVMLGQCYYRLIGLEQAVNGGQLSTRLRQTRYLQSVAAFRQATRADSNDITAWEGLRNAYQSMNRQDLMLEALDSWLELSETFTPPAARQEEFELVRIENRTSSRELALQLVEVDARLEEQIDNQIQQMEAAEAQNRGELAQTPDAVDSLAAQKAILTAVIYNSAGRPRRALEALQASEAAVSKDPIGVILHGQLLLETGELEEAHRRLLSISQEALKDPKAFASTDWQLPVAISQLGILDYTLAAQTWDSQLKLFDQQAQLPFTWTNALLSQPLAADVNFQSNQFIPVWPILHLQFLTSQLSINESLADVALMQAVVFLEQGQNTEAATLLERVIGDFGDTQVRRLAMVYYDMVSPDSEAFLAPLNVSPWEEFEFPGEIRPPEPPAGALGDPAAMPAGVNPAGGAFSNPLN